MNEAPSAPSVRIEIIADLVCPWCYIGKHRLEAAVAAYSGLNVNVHWRPYQLDPSLPEDGLDLRAYRAKKKNSAIVEARQSEASLAGEALGIRFAWDKIERMPNTRDAHRLIRLAVLYGRQSKLVERLFKAYFCEGLDIGNRRLLIDLAADCGIDREGSEQLFAGQDDILAVEEELATTRLYGLTTVPCFMFDDDIVIPGAATRQVFMAALFEAQKTPIDPKRRLF